MKNSFFQIIILFKKAVKEIQHSSNWKFVAKKHGHDNFFYGPKSEK